MLSSELTHERRQFYRIAFGQEDHEVTVWTDNGDGLIGEVVDVSAQGVAIHVPRSTAPVLTLGESVAFPFTPRGQDDPVALRAIVRSRNLVGKRWRYGFEFQIKSTLSVRYAEEFYGLFNRRNAYRVKPPPGAPIMVTLAGLKVSTAPAATAQLKDVSATGLSVLVPANTDSALKDDEILHTTLRPPTSTRSLKLAGRVRHRTERGSAVCYGLQFDPKYCEQFEQDHEEVVDYIIHRQLDQLADHPDPTLTRAPLQLSPPLTAGHSTDQARTA